jgi:hypothetical protein
MDKTTMLFIRACKSNAEEDRVMSVYRRFYLATANKETNLTHINYILCKIVEEYKLMTLSQLLTEMHPSRDWLYQEDSVLERQHRVLLLAIRFADIKKFPGLIPPLKFK